MSKQQEFHFSYKALVLALKQFHLRKKVALEEDIKDRLFSDNGLPKARQYVEIVESVLNSEYFSENIERCTVGELMTRLKEDDVAFLKRMEEIKVNLQEMWEAMESVNRSANDTGYMIPDEVAEYEASLAAKKKEYIWNIAALQDELKLYEYRLKLCRNLKGMIQRPNGFYDAVYRAKGAC